MEHRINTTQKKKMRSFPNSKFYIPHSTLRGFTVFELLIVVAILGVLLATILPSLLNFRRYSILNTEAQELVTMINRARLLSVSSKNDQRFGMHFEAGKIVIFQGSTYSSGATTNEAHTFDRSLTLSSIVINGGGSELLFEKVTGATSQNATTTLLVTGTMASTTVIVRPTGVATIY
ncbi:MAG: prepilin-type N-terminal cleavage/methylation domain-containing protein [Candidatus Yonathbacteria bacterium]|nr:prepilin-type N-terminal cleavage/methylation domain-containing protein [Candidatus Yonathbacteria bacterium]